MKHRSVADAALLFVAQGALRGCFLRIIFIEKTGAE